MQLLQKFVSRCHVWLVTTNVPDPHHWTLNSCFSVFRNVWVPLGPFRYCTELGAKWVELVQLMKKFAPRNRIRVFRNERTRSTPLDSRLMFWCVAYYLGAFDNVWLPYKTRCKTGWSGAKVRAMKSCRNFSQQPLDPPHRALTSCFVAFRTIWVHLGQFVALQHSFQMHPNSTKRNKTWG